MTRERVINCLLVDGEGVDCVLLVLIASLNKSSVLLTPLWVIDTINVVLGFQDKATIWFNKFVLTIGLRLLYWNGAVHGDTGVELVCDLVSADRQFDSSNRRVDDECLLAGVGVSDDPGVIITSAVCTAFLGIHQILANWLWRSKVKGCSFD